MSECTTCGSNVYTPSGNCSGCGGDCGLPKNYVVETQVPPTFEAAIHTAEFVFSDVNTNYLPIKDDVVKFWNNYAMVAPAAINETAINDFANVTTSFDSNKLKTVWADNSVNAIVDIEVNLNIHTDVYGGNKVSNNANTNGTPWVTAGQAGYITIMLYKQGVSAASKPQNIYTWDIPVTDKTGNIYKQVQGIVPFSVGTDPNYYWVIENHTGLDFYGEPNSYVKVSISKTDISK